MTKQHNYSRRFLTLRDIVASWIASSGLAAAVLMLGDYIV